MESRPKTTTFSRSQDGDGIFRSEIGPVQWNLTLAAFLVEETDSLFTAVFFACQSFKLAARERMKGMRDPRPLGLCSTNGCSPTPLSRSPSTLKTRLAQQVQAAPKHISSSSLPVKASPHLALCVSGRFAKGQLGVTRGPQLLEQGKIGKRLRDV
jgi:hypothetical protein